MNFSEDSLHFLIQKKIDSKQRLHVKVNKNRSRMLKSQLLIAESMERVKRNHSLTRKKPRDKPEHR